MRGYIQAMQQQAALAQQQQRQQPAAPPPAPTPIPDPALDPEGYHRHMQEQFAERERHMAGVAEQQAAETRFDTSVMVHSQRIGSENVASVAEWVRKQGDDVGTWFSNQRDPIGAAIQAYQKSAVQAEIGNDPAAYWQQRETAIQAHAMERARAELTQQMRAGAPAPLIPPSLATQTRSSPNGAPEVMGTDRDFVRGFLSERRAR